MGKHSLYTTLGTDYQRTSYTYNGVGAEGFPNDFTRVVSSGARFNNTFIGSEDGFIFMGGFGHLRYDYDSKYYATFVLRGDGSSRYGSDVPVLLSPALSLGWMLHKESFMDSTDFINTLKLRASIGRSYNSLIGNDLMKATGEVA